MIPKYFAVQQSNREADIYIFGDIVADRWDETDTSAFSLKEAIKDLDVDVINVYIDSYGGYVSEGWAIYNELRRHPAKVRTFGTGFVASAALYPFMAGDERYAMEPSAYFFHQILSAGYGNADELRKTAAELEKLNEIGRAAFTDNTRLTSEDVQELEQNETWLSPQEALNVGIATAVLKNTPSTLPSQSVKTLIIQKALGTPVLEPTSAPFAEPAPALDPEPEHPNKSQSAGIMQLLGNALFRE